jgi:hypothetical protein
VIEKKEFFPDAINVLELLPGWGLHMETHAASKRNVDQAMQQVCLSAPKSER